MVLRHCSMYFPGRSLMQRTTRVAGPKRSLRVHTLLQTRSEPQMKRVLFALPLMLMATSAFAAGLTVTNHSGLPIDELTASPAGKNTFGANLMDGIKEGALDDGKTVTIAALADGK